MGISLTDIADPNAYPIRRRVSPNPVPIGTVPGAPQAPGISGVQMPEPSAQSDTPSPTAIPADAVVTTAPGGPQPGVTPPSGATDAGTDQPETASTGNDYLDQSMRLAKEVFPGKDYFAEARKRVGEYPKPQTPGISGTEALAAAIPGILGMFTGGGMRGFSGSSAMLEGLAAGRARQQQAYNQGLSRYQDDLSRVANSLQTADTERGRAVFGDVSSQRREVEARHRDDITLKVADEKNKLSVRHQQFLEDNARTNQDIARLRLGTEQDRVAIQSLNAESEREYRAAKLALDQQRTDLYAQHMARADALRNRAEGRLDSLAAKKLAETSGLPKGKDKTTQLLALSKFINGQLATAQAELGLETDPTKQGAIQQRIDHYQGLAKSLQSQLDAAVAGTPTPSPAAPTNQVPPELQQTDPKPYTGKTITGPGGKRYRSDGTQWIPVP